MPRERISCKVWSTTPQPCRNALRMAKKWLKLKIVDNNVVEITLKNRESHIFESKKIDDWFSVHLCEKCKSEVNCVYNIENGRLQNIRYKCKHCGHEVFINTRDVKEIKSV